MASTLQPFASSASDDGSVVTATTSTTVVPISTLISPHLEVVSQVSGVSDDPHQMMESPIRRILPRPTNPLDPPPFGSGSQASSSPFPGSSVAESPLLVTASPSSASTPSPHPPPPLRLFSEQTIVAPFSPSSTTADATTPGTNPLAAEFAAQASASHSTSTSILGPRSDSTVGTTPTRLEKQRIDLRESALSVVEVHPVCPKCRLEIRPSMEVSCVLPPQPGSSSSAQTIEASPVDGENTETPAPESNNREEVKLELAFRVLRCGHAFCDRCIETMHEDQTIFCWTCSMDTPLPTNDIRDLPKNFILNDIAQGPMPKQAFLDRVATCPICCEMYNETHLPRVLLCGHTFCGHCISECIVPNKLKIRCPYKCHVLTPLVDDEDERRGSAEGGQSSTIEPSSTITGDITPPVNAGLLTQLMFAPALAELFRSIPTHIMPFPDSPFLADSIVPDPNRPLPPIYARFRPRARPRRSRRSRSHRRTSSQPPSQTPSQPPTDDATNVNQGNSEHRVVWVRTDDQVECDRCAIGLGRCVYAPMALGVGGYSLWLFIRFGGESCEKPLAPLFLALACLLLFTLGNIWTLEISYYLRYTFQRRIPDRVFCLGHTVCHGVTCVSIVLYAIGVAFSFQLPSDYYCPRTLVISTRVLSLFYLVPMGVYGALFLLVCVAFLDDEVRNWRQRRRSQASASADV